MAHSPSPVFEQNVQRSSATANGLRDYRMYSIPSASARILRWVKEVLYA
jgi:hypothetical protein